eukprot:COSAG01_NODE_6830_length_3481_cov_4.968953_1_plen_59_part_00
MALGDSERAALAAAIQVRLTIGTVAAQWCPVRAVVTEICLCEPRSESHVAAVCPSRLW